MGLIKSSTFRRGVVPNRREQFRLDNPTSREIAKGELDRRGSSGHHESDRSDEESFNPALLRTKNSRRTMADVLPKLAEPAPVARQPEGYQGKEKARADDWQKTLRIAKPTPKPALAPKGVVSTGRELATIDDYLEDDLLQEDVPLDTPPQKPTAKPKARSLDKVFDGTPPPDYVVTQQQLDDSCPEESGPGNALVPMSGEPADLRAVLKSRFGDNSERILDLLDSDDTADGAISLLSRNLLQMLVSLLPIAENYVRVNKGSKGVQNLTLLSSQIRDALVDLQALRDKGNLGRTLMDNHIRPSYSNLGVQIMSSYSLINNFAMSRMSPTDFVEFRAHVEKLQHDLAIWMSISYESLETAVVQSMT